MSDLEILFLRRLMARDAAIWAGRNGHRLIGDGAAQVLAEWRGQQYGERQSETATASLET